MRLALLAVLLPAVVSCDKDQPKSTAASASASAPLAVPSPSALASAIAATAPPAASTPPPPNCPAGLAGNAFPAYCIKLPTGYGPKETRTTPKRGSIEYETGTTTDVLSITYDDTSVAELAKQVEGEMKFGHDKLEKKGDLAGGNKWFQGSHDEYARIVTLLKAQGGLTLKCSFAYQPKKPPPAGAVEACKSIVVP